MLNKVITTALIAASTVAVAKEAEVQYVLSQGDEQMFTPFFLTTEGELYTMFDKGISLSEGEKIDIEAAEWGFTMKSLENEETSGSIYKRGSLEEGKHTITQEVNGGHPYLSFLVLDGTQPINEVEEIYVINGNEFEVPSMFSNWEIGDELMIATQFDSEWGEMEYFMIHPDRREVCEADWEDFESTTFEGSLPNQSIAFPPFAGTMANWKAGDRILTRGDSLPSKEELAELAPEEAEEIFEDITSFFGNPGWTSIDGQELFLMINLDRGDLIVSWSAAE